MIAAILSIAIVGIVVTIAGVHYAHKERDEFRAKIAERQKRQDEEQQRTKVHEGRKAFT